MIITADRVIHDGYAHSGVGIEISDDGRIAAVGRVSEMGKPDRVFDGRVLLCGQVNAHSHAFQRLLRGRTQFAGPQEDSFWTWREAMYWVSRRLDPHAVYVASRQAFLEMLLCGTTTVGEFHYLHHQPDGEPYPQPHALSDAVIEAARDVGIRLALMRVVYLRGDFDSGPSADQQRFCDPSIDVACDRFDDLVHRIIGIGDSRLSWAIAAHSIRAVSYEELVSLKLRLSHMPFHIHVSEQRREVDACLDAHSVGPVELLARHDLLDSCTTLVHATHLRPGDAAAIAQSGALVCVCPSTEADLGDGLGPVGDLYGRGVSLCLGTDGQTLSSVIGEARRLEMHERLRTQRRNALTTKEGDSVAANLLHMATSAGATALGVDTGQIRVGKWADFVTVDIEDPALEGADDWTLLPSLVFSSDARSLRDVMVGGKLVVRDGVHPKARASALAFRDLCETVFTGADI